MADIESHLRNRKRQLQVAVEKTKAELDRARMAHIAARAAYQEASIAVKTLEAGENHEAPDVHGEG